MPDTKELKRARLSYVGIIEKAERKTLVVKLTGDEVPLVAAETALKKQFPKAYTELDLAEKTLAMHMAVGSEQEAQEVVSRVHASTVCKLSHLAFDVATRPISAKSKLTVHEPLIMVEALRDKPHPDNRVGCFSVGVLRDMGLIHNAIIADPTFDEKERVRLMCFMEQGATPMAALMIAEQHVEKLEREFGMAVKKPKHLKLTDIQTVKKKSGGGVDGELYATSATLKGHDEEAIERALVALRHRYRGDIVVGERDVDGHQVQVMSGDDRSDNPAGLLAAVHSTTHCELPVEVVAETTRSRTGILQQYRPVVTLPLTHDVEPKHRETVARAMGNYAGAFVPAGHRVVAGDSAARVIIDEKFLREEEAQKAAEGYSTEISSRIRNDGTGSARS